jgi:hypothetical protein
MRKSEDVPTRAPQRCGDNGRDAVAVLSRYLQLSSEQSDQLWPEYLSAFSIRLAMKWESAE